ncbi:hypothetical protein R70723_09055 [Paenibacillus sp. FSL R7-0273]|nr:hypothetical protein R70723_09055 [Paenibacillus sp. FSL R7-0273]
MRVLIAGFAAPFTCTQALLTLWDKHASKPSGKRVATAQGSLHVQVAGGGCPAVILEAGMGGTSLDWALVQPEIARMATVISYDRAGMGWSGRADGPATCGGYVRELRLLLKSLDVRPPYVLAGHSYGGMIMSLFAALYPEEVEGLLLVDATPVSFYLPEGMSPVRRQQRKSNRRQARLGYLLSPTGLLRLLRRPLGARRLPKSLHKQAGAIRYRSGAYKTLYRELLQSEQSARELQNAPMLSEALPVIVLSSGTRGGEWSKGQRSLAGLTARTRQIVAEDSPHSIQIHRPELVIAAIKELLLNSYS